MKTIFHLVYISEAVMDISYSDIHDILDKARKFNHKENVTGLLIFRDGYFIQLLEGKEDSVRKVLNRILLDDRNYSLRVVTESMSEQRLFSEVPLAFYDGDISSNSTEGLVSLFDACTEKNEKLPAETILPLFCKFKESAPSFQ
ncbi:MAG: BLUF domain-containing protein [Bdellovibrio sp.]